MNRLRRAKQAQIIAALVEGNSLRATSRMTGASKVTILRLLESLGAACAVYQDKALYDPHFWQPESKAYFYQLC